MDMRETATGKIEPHRCCAGGEEQCAVMMPGAVRKPYFAPLRIDRCHSRAELQLDPLIGVKLGLTQWDPFFGCRAGEIILGQVRAIVRPGIVGAQHRDRAGVALAPQHLGRSISCGTTADDDDRLRPRLRRRSRWPRGWLEFFTDPDPCVALFDPPARYRIERRRA